MIGKGIKFIGKKAIDVITGMAIEKAVVEGYRAVIDIFDGDDDKSKEKKEEKKQELQSHLQQQGMSFLQQNPEANRLASKLGEFERRGALDDPFNSEVMQTKRQFQSMMKKEMSRISERDAGKFGLKYQRPVSSLFDR